MIICMTTKPITITTPVTITTALTVTITITIILIISLLDILYTLLDLMSRQASSLHYKSLKINIISVLSIFL